MRVRRIVTAGAAVLAACGGLGMVPAAAQAGSAAGPTWTRQHPAAHPPAQGSSAMAYDGATHTVVLFGADAQTWTWNGTTWTQQHPATSPPAVGGASMAYDAATRTIVLYGGYGSQNPPNLHDTWTWNGTTWTEQHPAAHPGRGLAAAMAYDAATGTIVRLGTQTWTWNGTTWTEQHPTASPSFRYAAAMAYDAASGTVVLFGGCCTGTHDVLGDTWTWNGSTWTQQHPAASPPARDYASMAYDAATGSAVLFGGARRHGGFYSTWTWG